MESLGSKKLALIRIWQILKEYSDYNHPMTQEDISIHLENDYGIVIERKAISRNISLLKEAGVEIESCRAGSYLDYRDFEDAEIHEIDCIIRHNGSFSKPGMGLLFPNNYLDYCCCRRSVN